MTYIINIMSYWQVTLGARGRGLLENKSVSVKRISKCIVFKRGELNLYDTISRSSASQHCKRLARFFYYWPWHCYIKKNLNACNLIENNLLFNIACSVRESTTKPIFWNTAFSKVNFLRKKGHKYKHVVLNLCKSIYPYTKVR